MKIYLSGSHSTGKSTLVRYISEKYKLQIVSEVARMILSEKELNIDSLRADINLVNNYQQQVFSRQLAEEKKYDNFVSDRSLIDVLAYSQHTQILPSLLQNPELTTYINNLKLPGTFLFFVRPCKATMKADGVRESLNWDGIVAIDAQIKLLLQMFSINYFSINTDSMQERIQLIDSVLAINSEK